MRGSGKEFKSCSEFVFKAPPQSQYCSLSLSLNNVITFRHVSMWPKSCLFLLNHSIHLN